MSDKVGEMLREIMQDYITLASERDELMQARNGLIENNDNLHIQLAEMRAQRDEGLAREVESREWKFCPECGSEDLHHQEGTHKQCNNCYQEYWSDSDYTDVVRGHLAKLQPLQQRLAEAEKLANSLMDEYDNCHRDGRPFRAGPLLEQAHRVLATPEHTNKQKLE